MRIITTFKVVPDDQDIQIKHDGSLDYARAKGIVSAYDLNALEAAASLKSFFDEAKTIAVTVGSDSIDESKLKKNVLARGMDELYMIADDACADMDAYATAAALADLLEKIGDWDIIVCGDGSADNYAQQTDVQLAARLNVPVVNGVTKIDVLDNKLRVERSFKDVVEIVDIEMPCVISVTPDIGIPRIPGMKDILAAGKKPMNIFKADSSYASAIEIIECKAPKAADRKLNIAEASEAGALENFAAALKAAL